MLEAEDGGCEACVTVSAALLSPDPESARERGCDQREMVSCHNTGTSNCDSDTAISVHCIRWWLSKLESVFNTIVVHTSKYS